jgi:hypothetical protein
MEYLDETTKYLHRYNTFTATPNADSERERYEYTLDSGAR